MARPEILAPAGSVESLTAALAAGADAIYFGVDEGFNARARAVNFPLAGLPATVERIHRGGARAYLTLNTLVFQGELDQVEEVIKCANHAGVDALIVQDPAVCRLARRCAPDLELHASTQMTISSPEGARFAADLGVTRVVLPRELSMSEIAKFVSECPLETEVFIAGALCMSWSGQCLSSEAWGGRSANRGQCAQACRHPYDLVVDGEQRELGGVAHLLSPQDLGGFRFIQQLSELGVHTLKIEGRQKDADYVFQATRAVREWVDQAVPETQRRERLRDLSLTYSRGLSDGFFGGSDHQTLVEGRLPRHRGLPLGVVTQVQGRDVWVRDVPPPPDGVEPRAGLGVVFRRPNEPVEQDKEQGGALWTARPSGEPGGWVLGFGRGHTRLHGLQPGDEVWATGDPLLKFKDPGAPEGRWALRLEVRGAVDQPIQVTARWQGGEAVARSSEKLSLARSRGMDEELLRDKLGAWGGTPFRLGELDLAELDGQLFLPTSNLKALRQTLAGQLETQMTTFGQGRRVVSTDDLPEVQAQPLPAGDPVLEALVRTPEQLEAVIESGVTHVTLDWMELIGLNGAVARAREAGLHVGLATVRVQKPGEESYDRRLQALAPEWVLARHWGACVHFADPRHKGPEIHGDFSLNVTNALTADLLVGMGLSTVTVAHDLDAEQLRQLLAAFPPSRLAVTLHHHVATFHTEHCVYSHLLSNGRDYRDCGRPCEQHEVQLQDRKGIRHPVIVDVGCRNTVFNGAAQSAARLVPELQARGIGRLRLEFVRETREQTRDVLLAYRELLAGRISPQQASARAGAHEQFGLSMGTMSTLRVLS